jgi:glycosyltransferase involved in cell wall biosynthesis
MTVGAGTRRVALVTAAGDAGGAERLMETLAGHVDRAAFTPVLSAPEDGRLVERWQSRGFETCALPAFGRLRRLDIGAKIVAEVVRRFRAAEIDIVHAHGVAAQIHAGLAARRMRRPAVYHVHDLFESSWSADGALQRFALRVPAARVIAISATVAASLQGRVATGKLQTILNGVELDPVDPVSVGTQPLVLWCGRLQHWKGPHHFIAAARIVRASRPDVRFAVVGGTLFGLEPDYRDFIEQQVADAGLEDVLEFVGQVEDARPWLRAASLLVHCADRPEPFGLVMAEAMVQERPIVAFRQGGASEIVVDGETGRLVAPRDVGALAAAMLEVLADPDKLATMGASGRRRAERYFDASRMADAVSGVYDAVSGAHE